MVFRPGNANWSRLVSPPTVSSFVKNQDLDIKFFIEVAKELVVLAQCIATCKRRQNHHLDVTNCADKDSRSEHVLFFADASENLIVIDGACECSIRRSKWPHRRHVW